MSKKLTKRILLEDRTYHSPDGEVAVTPERRKHWAKSFETLKSNGINIPVYWGHSDDPATRLPIATKNSRKRLPSEGVGWLTDFKALPDGGVEIELDVRDKDAEKVDANVAEISPVIFDSFKDGEDQSYEDIVGGMDLVHYPVDSTQTDFEPSTAVACSLRMSLESKPFTTYRLAAADQPAAGEDGQPSNISTERLSSVIAALSEMGVVLPEDTVTVREFFERVEAALLTAAAMQGGGTDAMDETTPEFAALSLEREKREAIEKEREQERKYNDKQLQTTVAGRLQLALENGQVSPARVEDLTAQVGTVRLSLNEDGEHTPSTVEAIISTLEANPPGTFWTDEERTKHMSVEEVNKPGMVTEGDDDVSAEEADDIVDRILRVKK